MNSYVIKVRTVCDKNKMKVYLNLFFRKATIYSRYINIQLKLYTNNNDIIEIGGNYLIDIQKPTEIKSFKLFIEQNFINYLNHNNGSKVNKVIFSYMKVTNKKYINQINEQLLK